MQSGCNCAPPDTHWRRRPESLYSRCQRFVQVFDKNGNTSVSPDDIQLTLCAFGRHALRPDQNRGDPFVFYDHLADRWVMSNFAFAAFPGANFYNASPCPRRATLSQAAGISTPC